MGTLIKRMEKFFRFRNETETESVGQRASDHFVHGNSNCSEAVLRAFETRYPKTVSELMGAAYPFGGGIAGQGQTCGALTGSLLLYGALAARKGVEKKDIRDISALLFREFSERFSSDRCSVLSAHSCDENPAEEFDLNHCSPFISFCASRIEELLQELEKSVKKEERAS